MKKRMLKNMDWWILVCAILLSVVGLVALFSATQESDFEDFKKQTIWLGVSLVVMLVVMFVDYEILAKVSPIAYATCLILLIAVLFTEEINGATSWFDIGFFSLQPAEFGKIFVIIFFAYILVKMQEKGRGEINKPWKLLVSMLVFIIPILLIVKQPDYGTAMAYLLAMVLMLFVAGLDKRYIIISIVVLAIATPLVYNFVLPEHAKTRIEVFLNPESDPRGAGYNVIQSKLAIGAGQLTGMGLLKGNQTQLGFLYPKTTDFIYAVIGEEMGFIVASAVIVLNVVLIVKAIYIAKTAKDDLGSYIATGIAGIFFFHTLENIGMTMGLLPITGVPLLFVSYGGSSLITSFICIGVLLNISGKRQKTIFVK